MAYFLFFDSRKKNCENVLNSPNPMKVVYVTVCSSRYREIEEFDVEKFNLKPELHRAARMSRPCSSPSSRYGRQSLRPWPSW